MRGPTRGAICLGALCALLVGLFAFPGSGGQDPYHTHIVIGGTSAERARALALHLLHEREGIDVEVAVGSDADGRTGSAGVHVYSIRTNDGGPAVLSMEAGGAVLLVAAPPVPAPSRAPWVATYPQVGIPQVAPPTLDPPPRHIARA
jgi:hypothetical protein